MEIAELLQGFKGGYEDSRGLMGMEGGSIEITGLSQGFKGVFQELKGDYGD